MQEPTSAPAPAPTAAQQENDTQRKKKLAENLEGEKKSVTFAPADDGNGHRLRVNITQNAGEDGGANRLGDRNEKDRVDYKNALETLRRNDITPEERAAAEAVMDEIEQRRKEQMEAMVAAALDGIEGVSDVTTSVGIGVYQGEKGEVVEYTFEVDATVTNEEAFRAAMASVAEVTRQDSFIINYLDETLEHHAPERDDSAAAQVRVKLDRPLSRTEQAQLTEMFSSLKLGLTVTNKEISTSNFTELSDEDFNALVPYLLRGFNNGNAQATLQNARRMAEANNLGALAETESVLAGDGGGRIWSGAIEQRTNYSTYYEARKEYYRNGDDRGTRKDYTDGEGNPAYRTTDKGTIPTTNLTPSREKGRVSRTYNESEDKATLSPDFALSAPAISEGYKSLRQEVESIIDNEIAESQEFGEEWDGNREAVIESVARFVRGIWGAAAKQRGSQNQDMAWLGVATFVEEAQRVLENKQSGNSVRLMLQMEQGTKGQSSNPIDGTKVAKILNLPNTMNGKRRVSRLAIATPVPMQWCAKANGTFMKAPNGKPTNLTERQWLQVRTKAFKKWFGDWEKSARIEKLRKSKAIENHYNGDYELNRNSAKQWMLDNIRGEYTNQDTGETITISKVGINEVTSHGSTAVEHLKSLHSIPDMIENAIFIDEISNTKENDKYDSYRYYVCGLKIDGVDYTAKIVVGVKDGSKYYDHRLTEIEKGALLDHLNGLSNSVAENQNTSFAGKDTKLISILQTNSSKVVDENGEPLVVYHGARTGKQFYSFENVNNFFIDNKQVAQMFADEYAYQMIVDGEVYILSKQDAEEIASSIEPAYPNDILELFDQGVDNILDDITTIENLNDLVDYGGIQIGVDDFANAKEISIKPTPNPLFEVFLNMRNPQTIDFEGRVWEVGDDALLTPRLPHDGVIAKNIIEGGAAAEIDGQEPPVATDYVVNAPSQIKSATDNNGSFDESNDDIRFSISSSATGATPHMTQSEIATKTLVQNAQNDYNTMQSAIKKVGSDIRGIRKAMRLQSEYDRNVVSSLLNLYSTLMQANSVWAGYMPDTSHRVASQIVYAIGKEDISKEVNTIFDYIVDAQVKAAQRQWDKLRNTPIEKLNISGVVAQGKVALQGQHALKALNEALDNNLTTEQLENMIGEAMSNEMSATDESLRTQFKGRWIGYTIAQQHIERIAPLKQERIQLQNELDAARNNMSLKPAARRQLVGSIKEAMRDNYLGQSEAYAQSLKDLQEYVDGQAVEAKGFIAKQNANREKIRDYAAKDLEGIATNPHRPRTKRDIARSIWDAFASPMRDLQSMLRLCGRNTPDGEGYLYNHFMRNWIDGADREQAGLTEASRTLDNKMSELTHGKYKTWEEAARKINDKSHNKFSIKILNGVDGAGNPVEEEIPLNAGNALYIYAVNKMEDGRMKLSAMNITEEDVEKLVQEVREAFGQEILDVVDWIQTEYFSQLRNRYNPIHEDLFGAPMDAIENYFPLRINPNARQKNEDLGSPDTDASRLLRGTSTGAIKRRTRNSLPLDVRNADFFTEVVRHIAQMERWSAFAQLTRDANILFSDIDFRNRIKGMNGTIYGKGDQLYNHMKDAFKVALGTYQSKTDPFSEFALNMAKGVTSAKINFRIFTALKQLASFPAFFTYMTDGVFVKSYLRNWIKPHETMQWARTTLPNFDKRIRKRDMGDMRLMQRTTDWQWNKRLLELSSKYGMAANVFFDVLTCATGARAVYDSKYADYINKGYTEEEAAKRARQDAEVSFNTSQQSSEGAFMAPVQVDRNLFTAALTVFRTSNFQYTRNFFYAVRTLLNNRGKKDEMTASRAKQYIADGLTEEQARKAAETDWRKANISATIGIVVYGALLNLLWRLVGNAPYYLFGKDNEKKKELAKDAVTGGMLFSPFDGLIGGGIVESALDGHANVVDMFAPELPFTQDAKKAEQYLQNDKYAEFASQALSVLMQSGAGFDPMTAADIITRVATTIDSEQDLDTSVQFMRVSQALLSIPQSQYEQMLIDEVINNRKDYRHAVEDYKRYMAVHTAPLTWFLRGNENAGKVEKNAEKRFKKLYNERKELRN